MLPQALPRSLPGNRPSRLVLKVRRKERALPCRRLPPRRSWWIPAVCTTLGFLAMSPRLLLQPTLISLLFLSLTLFILQKPQHLEQDARRLESERRSPLAVYWLLVPLFALWVNLDSWF